MKTAEEHLYDNIFPFVLKPGIENAVIKAMKAYALQIVEQDRKDCAEKVSAKLEIEGIYGYSFSFKDSILNRPMPEMI